MTDLETIVDFLNGIGIDTREGPVPAASFLPGVRIERGGLVYDRAMPWPGDLLHEAGHIATAPAALRPGLSDDVGLPDSVPHATEAEATAWAYAAVRHLGLDPAVLFHAGGYHGASGQLLATYGAGVYLGAAGLAHAGLTTVGGGVPADGAARYPAMLRWLRA